MGQQLSIQGDGTSAATSSPYTASSSHHNTSAGSKTRPDITDMRTGSTWGHNISTVMSSIQPELVEHRPKAENELSRMSIRVAIDTFIENCLSAQNDYSTLPDNKTSDESKANTALDSPSRDEKNENQSSASRHLNSSIDGTDDYMTAADLESTVHSRNNDLSDECECPETKELVNEEDSLKKVVSVETKDGVVSSGICNSQPVQGAEFSENSLKIIISEQSTGSSSDAVGNLQKKSRKQTFSAYLQQQLKTVDFDKHEELTRLAMSHDIQGQMFMWEIAEKPVVGCDTASLSDAANCAVAMSGPVRLQTVIDRVLDSSLRRQEPCPIVNDSARNCVGVTQEPTKNRSSNLPLHFETASKEQQESQEYTVSAPTTKTRLCFNDHIEKVLLDSLLSFKEEEKQEAFKVKSNTNQQSAETDFSKINRDENNRDIVQVDSKKLNNSKSGYSTPNVELDAQQLNKSGYSTPNVELDAQKLNKSGNSTPNVELDAQKLNKSGYSRPAIETNSQKLNSVCSQPTVESNSQKLNSGYIQSTIETDSQKLNSRYSRCTAETDLRKLHSGYSWPTIELDPQKQSSGKSGWPTVEREKVHNSDGTISVQDIVDQVISQTEMISKLLTPSTKDESRPTSSGQFDSGKLSCGLSIKPNPGLRHNSLLEAQRHTVQKEHQSSTALGRKRGRPRLCSPVNTSRKCTPEPVGKDMKFGYQDKSGQISAHGNSGPHAMIPSQEYILTNHLPSGMSGGLPYMITSKGILPPASVKFQQGNSMMQKMLPSTSSIKTSLTRSASSGYQLNHQQRGGQYMSSHHLQHIQPQPLEGGQVFKSNPPTPPHIQEDRVKEIITSSSIKPVPASHIPTKSCTCHSCISHFSKRKSPSQITHVQQHMQLPFSKLDNARDHHQHPPLYQPFPTSSSHIDSNNIYTVSDNRDVNNSMIAIADQSLQTKTISTSASHTDSNNINPVFANTHNYMMAVTDQSLRNHSSVSHTDSNIYPQPVSTNRNTRNPGISITGQSTRTQAISSCLASQRQKTDTIPAPALRDFLSDGHFNSQSYSPGHYQPYQVNIPQPHLVKPILLNPMHSDAKGRFQSDDLVYEEESFQKVNRDQGMYINTKEGSKTHLLGASVRQHVDQPLDLSVKPCSVQSQTRKCYDSGTDLSKQEFCVRRSPFRQPSFDMPPRGETPYQEYRQQSSGGHHLQKLENSVDRFLFHRHSQSQLHLSLCAPSPQFSQQRHNMHPLPAAHQAQTGGIGEMPLHHSQDQQYHYSEALSQDLESSGHRTNLYPHHSSVSFTHPSSPSSQPQHHQDSTESLTSRQYQTKSPGLGIRQNLPKSIDLNPHLHSEHRTSFYPQQSPVSLAHLLSSSSQQCQNTTESPTSRQYQTKSPALGMRQNLSKSIDLSLHLQSDHRTSLHPHQSPVSFTHPSLPSSQQQRPQHHQDTTDASTSRQYQSKSPSLGVRQNIPKSIDPSQHLQSDYSKSMQAICVTSYQRPLIHNPESSYEETPTVDSSYASSPVNASSPVYPHSTSSPEDTQKINLGKHEPIQNIIGNHPPSDILFLICHLCRQTYGSLYGFRKHFRNQHGFEPKADHTIVHTISATKTAMAHTEPTDATSKVLQAQPMNDKIHNEDLQLLYQTAKGNVVPPPYHPSLNAVPSEDKSDSIREDQLHVTTKCLECPECDQTFQLNDFGSYKRHCRQHNLHRNSGPFACQDCERSFSEPTHLQEHIATHISFTPNMCGICRTFFSSPSYLTSHLQTAHGINGLGHKDRTENCESSSSIKKPECLPMPTVLTNSSSIKGSIPFTDFPLAVSTSLSAHCADPSISTLCATPSVSGISATPSISGNSSTPLISGNSTTPSISGISATPSISGISATPSISGISSTPSISGNSFTPLISGNSTTPSILGISATPSISGNSAIPSIAGLSATPSVTGNSATLSPALIATLSSIQGGAPSTSLHSSTSSSFFSANLSNFSAAPSLSAHSATSSTIITTQTALSTAPSTLSATLSSLSTTPSALSTTPSALSTAPSSLSTAPSSLSITSSALTTAPASLSTTLSAHSTASSSFSAISSALSTTPLVLVTTPSAHSSIPSALKSAPSAHSSTLPGHSFTPSALSSTPSAHSSTPSAQKSTPSAHSSTPSALKSTQSAHSSIPSAHSSIPSAHSYTPSALSSTPSAHSSTPSALSSTSSAHCATSSPSGQRATTIAVQHKLTTSTASSATSDILLPSTSKFHLSPPHGNSHIFIVHTPKGLEVQKLPADAVVTTASPDSSYNEVNPHTESYNFQKKEICNKPEIAKDNNKGTNIVNLSQNTDNKYDNSDKTKSTPSNRCSSAESASLSSGASRASSPEANEVNRYYQHKKYSRHWKRGTAIDTDFEPQTKCQKLESNLTDKSDQISNLVSSTVNSGVIIQDCESVQMPVSAVQRMVCVKSCGEELSNP